MHNMASYQKSLIIYILIIGVIAFLLFAVVNLIFYFLKRTKVFYEKKIWISVNLTGFSILVVLVIPAILDIFQSSYFEISNVVDIQTEVKANYSDKYILITDNDGAVYTCYDFLINTETLQNVDYPGTVVYAKHSKLMLDYYTGGS